MPILKRLIPPIESALKDAKMNKDEIYEVIMVGGSTKIPKVRQMVA